MGLILIIILILLIQYIIVNSKKTPTNTIKITTKKDNIENKFKTFVARPIYYDKTKESDFESDEDKFIDEYVIKSKLFNSTSNNFLINLAEYRDNFFDFRNKTNISSNLFTPVDKVNEMILLKPDLTGKNISDIYDDLVDNKY